MPATVKDVDGLFARYQPVYASHGIVTVPCEIVPGAKPDAPDRKKPLVRQPQKFGLPASHRIVTRFGSARALGFYAGPRNKLTILDVDSRDENVLADALARHGPTPLIVRTASSKFHGFYHHHGERRRIRPWRELPVDIIGAGLCIAPPSVSSKGAYEIIQGSLDDLDHLPVMRGLDARFYHGQTEQTSPPPKPASIASGGRNNSLFRHCMRQAHYVESLEALLDIATSFNMTRCDPPLAHDEVMQAAENAWGYTIRGENRFGQRWVMLPADEAGGLAVNHQDAIVLLMYLRSLNRPDATFWIANGLTEKLAWSIKRLSAARQTLINLGYVRCVRGASTGRPALFRWLGKPQHREARGRG